MDSMVSQALPHLEKGDIVIDAGNSEYTDTNVWLFLDIVINGFFTLFSSDHFLLF